MHGIWEVKTSSLCKIQHKVKAKIRGGDHKMLKASFVSKGQRKTQTWVIEGFNLKDKVEFANEVTPMAMSDLASNASEYLTTTWSARLTAIGGEGASNSDDKMAEEDAAVVDSLENDDDVSTW